MARPLWKLFAKPKKGGGGAKVIAVIWPPHEKSTFKENLPVSFMAASSEKFNEQFEMDANEVISCADEYWFDLRPVADKVEPAKPYKAKKTRREEPEDDEDDSDEDDDF